MLRQRVSGLFLVVHFVELAGSTKLKRGDISDIGGGAGNGYVNGDAADGGSGGWLRLAVAVAAAVTVAARHAHNNPQGQTEQHTRKHTQTDANACPCIHPNPRPA